VDVSTKAIMDTSREQRRNKRWPEALKREIVAATLKSGASVSVVAREYDVNANQVFGWRRRYLAEQSCVPAVAPPGLVPVMITSEPELERAASPERAQSDTIEIEVAGDCRVRVGASFDARLLKRVLDVLRKR
jgi:transposase-like protein